MATPLYLTGDSVVSAGLPTGERSAAMTAAISTPQVFDLSEVAPTNPAPLVSAMTTPPVAGPLWAYHGRWASPTLDGLVGSTLPAGSYQFFFGAQEGDAGANAKVACSAYVLESDGTTIRGRIYDSNAGLGTEYAISTPSVKGRAVTFAGSAVAGIAAGDQIVFEVWSNVGQPDGLVRPIRFYWDGNIAPVEGTGNASPQSYLVVPADGLFAAVTGASVVGTLTPAGALAIGSTNAIGAAGTLTPAGDLAISSGAETTAPSGILDLIGELSITLLSPAVQCGVKGILPWANFCGVELTNLARFWEYSRIFRPPGIELGCPPPAVLYQTTGEQQVFQTPNADPAPWFEQGNPASAEFLGTFLVPSVDSPLSRNVTPRQRGGAAIGPLVVGPRQITFDGVLVATTDRGREYGMAWLTDVLAGCEACDTCDLQLYFTSPGSDDPIEAGRYRFYDVALTSGVTITYDPCPEMCQVTFTLTAGTGERFRDPQVIMPLQSIPITTSGEGCVPFVEWFCQPADERVTAILNPPRVGVLGLILTVDCTFGPANGIILEIRADCFDAEPLASLTVGSLEAGSYLVVDAARQQVTYIGPDGVPVDGIGRISLADDQAIPWLELGHCSEARCVAIGRTKICSGGDNVLVGLQTQERIR